MDAEPGEEVDEHLGVMAGVRRMTVRNLVRDVGQGPAHLVVDCVGRQERLGIHRVHVVDAVQERRVDVGPTQRPDDDIEDDGTAERADMDGPGRGLAVIDDLRSADARCKLVGPVHGMDSSERRTGPGAD